MELLQCDDFKPFTPQPITRPHTTDTNNFNNNKITNKKTIKSADITDKRSSVINPPSPFDDEMTAFNDNFELIENFISDNFSNLSENNEKNLFLNNNRRKYSDDMSSIDPKLINENDDLSIPEHLKSDFDIDPFSLQYDQSISAFEPIIPKTEIINDLKRSVSLIQQNNDEIEDDFGSIHIHKPKSALPKVNSFRKKQNSTNMMKSNGSVVNSSACKNATASNRAKNSAALMNKSLSMVEPKPKIFKTKEQVEEYFNPREKNVSKSATGSPNKEVSNHFLLLLLINQHY